MKFEIGDKVKVVRRVSSHNPGGMGEGKAWSAGWVTPMDNLLHKVGEIIDTDSDIGYLVDFEGSGDHWNFPETALELVSDTFGIKGTDSKGNPRVLTINNLAIGTCVETNVDNPPRKGLILESSQGKVIAYFDGQYDCLTTFFDQDYHVITKVFGMPSSAYLLEEGSYTDVVWTNTSHVKQERIKELKRELKELEG